MEVIVRTDVEEVEARRGVHVSSIWKGSENVLAEKRKERNSAHSSPWGRLETWVIRGMVHDTVPWRVKGYAAQAAHTSGLQGPTHPLRA